MSTIVLNGSGNNRSVIITFDGMSVGLRTQYLNTISESLFDVGFGDHGTPEVPIEWDDLTDEAKLTIILDGVRHFMKSHAKSKHINKRVKDEKLLAEEEANTLFDGIV